MRHDRNWQCYLSLDQRRLVGKYVVIVAGQLVGTGKDLCRLVRRARRLHPRETPFVARIRDPRKLYAYRAR
ncbi:MAG: DUF5678 domain-containing protein [Planctomycetota bacterium]